MSTRTSLFAIVLFSGALVVPHLAHAAVPFFGPIVPNYTVTDAAGHVTQCAAGWGLLIDVINNVLSFLVTMVVVFVAPLMIAWSGFLMVVNPFNPSAKDKARSILTNTVIGIVISLSAWLIVNAVMATLYHPNGSTLSTWTNLLTSGGSTQKCLPQAGIGASPTQTPSISTAAVAVACAVQPLTPLTDPVALQMEAGQTVVWTNTDPRLKPCVDKFISQVGGTVTSAYRPQSYQTHLWEIKDRWCTQGLQSNTQAVCAPLKQTISSEVSKHFGPNWACGAVARSNSAHSSGIGVDIAGINQSSPSVQQAAAASCLQWKNYSGDPYHYDLMSSCSC